jgi:hypothetical protein
MAEEDKKISETLPLESILKKTLKIPAYQRSYKWETDHVKNLLSDIWENQKMRKDVPYMVGTVIIHEQGINDETFFDIVDGQQRLTTLTFMLHALGYKEEMSLLHEKYLTPNSIEADYKYINYWLNKYDINRDDFQKYILEKIFFVIIKTKRLDEAFVFFDSQNSRGKSLERKDLLKAHHLRYVENDEIATNSAKEWEKLDKKGQLTRLIENILGRTRQRIRKESSDFIDVLQEFKAQRINKKKDSFYRLSKYHQPPIFEKWRYIDRGKPDDDDGLELIFRDIDAWQGTKRLKFVEDSKKFLPLQLMQPLEGGEQFFWYIQKYEQLFEYLFEQENIPDSTKAIYKIMQNGANWNIGMSRLKEIFEAALLFYYDKFGDDDFEKFALCLEHALFYLRYRQSSIPYATVRNYIIKEFNPFSIINEAAFPENCIYHIDDFVRGKYKTILPEKYQSGIRKWYHEEISKFAKANKKLYEVIELKDNIKFLS